MENGILKKHIADLMRTSDARGRYTHTEFLSLAEQSDALEVIRDARETRYKMYGGSQMSERQIIIFGSEDEIGYPFDIPVKAIEIMPRSEKFGEEMSHRDYLGAVLNLGIDRKLTGDIIVKGKRAWLFCMEQIADLICSELTKVRHTDVVCRIADGEIPELSPEFEELSLNVAAERIDVMTAALVNKSRTFAAELIKSQQVYVNGISVIDTSRTLKEGDVISIRHFGKYIYDGMSGRTKKGRYYAAVRKYV